MIIAIKISEEKYKAIKKCAERGMELDSLYKAVFEGKEIPDGWVVSDPNETYFMLKSEVPVIRKILSIANTMYTVLDSAEYSASKADEIVRRLKLWEEKHE